MTTWPRVSVRDGKRRSRRCDRFEEFMIVAEAEEFGGKAG